jgi:hypothetical protein
MMMDAPVSKFSGNSTPQQAEANLTKPKGSPVSQKEPILFIDVTMVDHSARLTIYEGECPDRAVAIFAKDHNLSLVKH